MPLPPRRQTNKFPSHRRRGGEWRERERERGKKRNHCFRPTHPCGVRETYLAKKTRQRWRKSREQGEGERPPSLLHFFSLWQYLLAKSRKDKRARTKGEGKGEVPSSKEKFTRGQEEKEVFLSAVSSPPQRRQEGRNPCDVRRRSVAPCVRPSPLLFFLDHRGRGRRKVSQSSNKV